MKAPQQKHCCKRDPDNHAPPQAHRAPVVYDSKEPGRWQATKPETQRNEHRPVYILEATQSPLSGNVGRIEYVQDSGYHKQRHGGRDHRTIARVQMRYPLRHGEHQNN